MTNITKDAMYDAVAPDDFESMLQLDRYNARSTAFDKIISATHDHFWDPLDKDYIDFDEPFDMENEAAPARGHDRGPADQLRQGDAGRPEDADPLHQRPDAAQLLVDPAWRAGGAEPLGLALPRALRPGRAGVRGQPDPRGSPPRHRLRQVHQGSLGPPGGLQPGAAELAGRDHLLARGLQEDHRHADAGRGPGHGRLRHLLPEAQRPARPQADAAGDDRRGLPPQVREDLGRPHRARS